jgi:outer membrane protein OmpA-like peptidoglycan-associated protein
MRNAVCLLAGLLALSGAAELRAQEQIVTKEQILQQLLGSSKAISARQRTSVSLPTVTFEFNSATLTEQGKRQLDELAEALAEGRLSERTVLIAGHTDSIGSDGYNMALSDRRAASARSYLVEVHQLSPEQLQAIGYGETKPLPDRPTTAAGQRRVEVVIEPLS